MRHSQGGESVGGSACQIGSPKRTSKACGQSECGMCDLRRSVRSA